MWILEMFTFLTHMENIFFLMLSFAAALLFILCLILVLMPVLLRSSICPAKHVLTSHFLHFCTRGRAGGLAEDGDCVAVT